ncbi:periplasmic heavy metal sensor [Nisaea acidiphila]|uniref:Periplasmic heavy metal sensor n=1 Tax=Nisaea acidiphila TaxID=1862145 RepID=A0A9J7ARM5_9PROT|nr:periplasmic heavy metal sensor [Nisaea acidiphila]UUX50016.1 periplasmic heavy metal sensor [Nisaea acidiphila]
MTWTRTRTLALLLFVSVAFNLFVAGMSVGRWDRWDWHRGPHDGPRHGKPMSKIIEYTLGDSLTPEIRERLERHHDAMQETFRESRESRREIRDILIQEPFDREAYLVALDRMSAVHDRMRAETHSFMIEIMEELTPEQRRKLVEKLDRKRRFDDD